jgi:hypothetical protein
VSARRRQVAGAARAIRRSGKRHHRADRREQQYAEVKSKSPLTADLHDSSIRLPREKLTLGQWARRYDRRRGIKVGDTLVVQPMPNGDWYVADVISDSDPNYTSPAD